MAVKTQAKSAIDMCKIRHNSLLTYINQAVAMKNGCMLSTIRAVIKQSKGTGAVMNLPLPPHTVGPPQQLPASWGYQISRCTIRRHRHAEKKKKKKIWQAYLKNTSADVTP